VEPDYSTQPGMVAKHLEGIVPVPVWSPTTPRSLAWGTCGVRPGPTPSVAGSGRVTVTLTAPGDAKP